MSLLEAGADANAKTRDGTPVLHIAATHTLKAVEALLQSGADVDAPDAEGRTALVRAVVAGRRDTALALLAGGADAKATDAGVNLPLIAFRTGELAVMEELLKRGANARAKNALLPNPAHLVLEAPHPSPLSASSGFFGCNHFQKANAFLETNGAPPFDWRL